mmetsp:Transcript_12745/g.35880  ORF Transcript_12745/g.35880 Transcript_12745/m.35880 type:complete len:257 (+) Transcript_12745:159-929(+)
MRKLLSSLLTESSTAEMRPRQCPTSPRHSLSLLPCSPAVCSTSLLSSSSRWSAECARRAAPSHAASRCCQESNADLSARTLSHDSCKRSTSGMSRVTCSASGPDRPRAPSRRCSTAATRCATPSRQACCLARSAERCSSARRSEASRRPRSFRSNASEASCSRWDQSRKASSLASSWSASPFWRISFTLSRSLPAAASRSAAALRDSSASISSTRRDRSPRPSMLVAAARSRALASAASRASRRASSPRKKPCSSA